VCQRSYSIADVVSISLTTPGWRPTTPTNWCGSTAASPSRHQPVWRKQVLDLRDAVLSGGRAVRIDDGLHVNAYPGDGSGNGDYDGGDLTRMDRVSSD